MKELFPLKTFHQDAVLKRLVELYDNEVDLDSRVEDLEDLDLPTPAVADSGKVIKVNAEGKYELASNPVDPSDLQGEDIAPKDVSATGNITGNSIIEIMNGYSFIQRSSDLGWTPIYVGIAKNGNKLTLVVFGSTTNDLETAVSVLADIGYFIIPSDVGSKLYPYTLGIETDILDTKVFKVVDNSKQPYTESGEDFILNIRKTSNTRIECRIAGSLKPGTHYFRFEETFLLSNNLVQ